MMKINVRTVTYIVLFLSIYCQNAIPAVEDYGKESRVSFNKGWLFSRFGLMPDGSTKEEPQGLEGENIRDSEWRKLDLPHDWGIEGPFRIDLPSTSGKLPWAGIGWYR